MVKGDWDGECRCWVCNVGKFFNVVLDLEMGRCLLGLCCLLLLWVLGWLAGVA